MFSCVRENVATQKEWCFPVPIDEPEMWSEPAANERLHLRVFRCVGRELVGARIEGAAVGVTQRGWYGRCVSRLWC